MRCLSLNSNPETSFDLRWSHQSGKRRARHASSYYNRTSLAMTTTGEMSWPRRFISLGWLPGCVGCWGSDWLLLVGEGSGGDAHNTQSMYYLPNCTSPSLPISPAAGRRDEVWSVLALCWTRPKRSSQLYSTASCYRAYGTVGSSNFMASSYV